MRIPFGDWAPSEGGAIATGAIHADAAPACHSCSSSSSRRPATSVISMQRNYRQMMPRAGLTSSRHGEARRARRSGSRRVLPKSQRDDLRPLLTKKARLPIIRADAARGQHAATSAIFSCSRRTRRDLKAVMLQFYEGPLSMLAQRSKISMPPP